jgi:hypothetical protein
LILTGCASGVQRPSDATKREAYFAKGGKVADVTISLSKEARAQLTDNLGFNQDRLLATVKRAMEGKDLLAKGNSESLPKIEILVTEIRMRSTFSAIAFGFMAGNDRVVGDVIGRNSSGQELQRFTVSASYALGGIGGGTDDARMSWLYETFAKHMIEELTGSQETAPAK